MITHILMIPETHLYSTPEVYAKAVYNAIAKSNINLQQKHHIAITHYAVSNYEILLTIEHPATETLLSVHHLKGISNYLSKNLVWIPNKRTPKFKYAYPTDQFNTRPFRNSYTKAPNVFQVINEEEK